MRFLLSEVPLYNPLFNSQLAQQKKIRAVSDTIVVKYHAHVRGLETFVQEHLAHKKTPPPLGPQA